MRLVYKDHSVYKRSLTAHVGIIVLANGGGGDAKLARGPNASGVSKLRFSRTEAKVNAGEPSLWQYTINKDGEVELMR